MTKSDHRVSVDSGKYTFVVPADDYRVSILRYGKPWHGPQSEASNFVEHPDAHTFTVGEVACGELFAVRWAFDRKDPAQAWSVLVFEIGSTPVLVEEF